ncbi:hypothetical protein ACTMTI_48130 [Nonomuraea sp. H19]|uniref:hypothetical protein n=1 Tax=Nonomuraea sp. H19 TaxID=3452206 RepID=UPI003F8A6A80
MRIFAPSAANLLSPYTCGILRSAVLQHKNATVRVVVLNPGEPEAIAIAARHLDGSDDHRVQSLSVALAAVLERHSMTEADRDVEARIIDLTGLSLAQLSAIDDTVLGLALRRALENREDDDPPTYDWDASI